MVYRINSHKILSQENTVNMCFWFLCGLTVFRRVLFHTFCVLPPPTTFNCSSFRCFVTFYPHVLSFSHMFSVPFSSLYLRLYQQTLSDTVKAAAHLAEVTSDFLCSVGKSKFYGSFDRRWLLYSFLMRSSGASQ